jgi:arylsulfatase A-like enzyme
MKSENKQQTMSSDRQNILFIFTDQHRRDMVGAYGSDVARTPNIDSLAEDGVIFDNAYTVCPVCTPARASVQTGLYPIHHGMQNNLFQPGCVVHELPDRPELLSRRLREAGYRAGYTGKWHLGYGKEAHQDPWYDEHDVEAAVDMVQYPDYYRMGSGLPTHLGYEGDDFPGHGAGGQRYRQFHNYLRENDLRFDLQNTAGNHAEVVSGPESTVDYFLTERAMHYIDCFRRDGSPWFFSLNFWGPHAPANVPTEYLDAYRDQPMVPWANFEEDLSDKPSIHNAKRDASPWSEREEHIRYTYAYGHFIDAQIGRVLDYLRRHGLYDNTCIIFAADHGDSLGCHRGLSDKAFHMYEETCTIPLIIKPAGEAGGRRGRRETAFANTTDLYSTVLEAAGHGAGTSLRDGRSLLPLVAGEEVADWPDQVVTECTGLAYLNYTQRMLRTERYKYVFNCGDVDELYDLQEDPHEMHNLVVAGGYEMILDEMQQRLADWMRSQGDRALQGFYHLRRSNQESSKRT